MKNIYFAIFVFCLLTASCGNKTTKNSTEDLIEEEATEISDEIEVEELEVEELEVEEIMEEGEE
jgi:hypothetical protein